MAQSHQVRRGDWPRTGGDGRLGRHRRGPVEAEAGRQRQARSSPVNNSTLTDRASVATPLTLEAAALGRVPNRVDSSPVDGPKSPNPSLATGGQQVTRARASGQQVTTGASGQQVTTRASGQQVTTRASGQQVTTRASGQQVTTGASGQQVTTKASGQQVTTRIDIVDVQMLLPLPPSVRMKTQLRRFPTTTF